MSVSKAFVPRRVIGGVSVLLYPQGPYLDVAERVRIVHQTRHALDVERGEVLQVRPGCWIYRAFLQLDGLHYIGDAEIHLVGTDPASPDGTNPISCGQTSAVGQALEFAGFGDLKSVLARLGQPFTLADLGEDDPSPEHARSIAGVQTVVLDHTPYVSVAERIYQVYQSGTSLSMESCEIAELAGIWVYRATILVDERRYFGEAEIFFDATPGTPDATHPISCAQISAVGNALALAGFGDVRSILERLGKDAQKIDTPPLLSSADAVIRARQQQDQASRPVDPGRRVTQNQREQIAMLCQRLGKAEPAYEMLDGDEADQLIARWQAEQEELFHSAEKALRTPTPAHNSPEAPGVPMETVVDEALVRQLKRRWREAFQPAGNTNEQLAAWEAFKTHVCKRTVSDKAMPAACYELLLATIPRPAQRPSSSRPPTQKPSPSLVRQAPRAEPRLTPAPSTRTR